jgi:hypothetical protein
VAIYARAAAAVCCNAALNHKFLPLNIKPGRNACAISAFAHLLLVSAPAANELAAFKQRCFTRARFTGERRETSARLNDSAFNQRQI